MNPADNSDVRQKTILSLEVAVLMMALYVPTILQELTEPSGMLLNSFSQLFSYHSFSYIAVRVGRVAVIAFTLWVAGDLRLLNFRFKVRPDIAILCVGLPLTIALELEGRFLNPSHGNRAFTPSAMSHASPWMLALAIVALVGGTVFEEIFFRGYLMSRFEAISGNRWAALCLSTVLFALGHTYQGAYGPIHATIFGLIMGLIFMYTRRLTTVAIIHAAVDLAFLYLMLTGKY